MVCFETFLIVVHPFSIWNEATFSSKTSTLNLNNFETLISVCDVKTLKAILGLCKKCQYLPTVKMPISMKR